MPTDRTARNTPPTFKELVSNQPTKLRRMEPPTLEGAEVIEVTEKGAVLCRFKDLSPTYEGP